MTGRRHVFLSLVCQDDNIGDLAIRREMVRWSSGSATTVHALVRGTRPDLVDAVELPPDARRYDSRARWQAAMTGHGLRGDTTLIYAPGPQTLTASAGEVAHAVVNLGNSALLRARGNHVAKMGRSITGDGRLLRSIERAQHRLTSDYWLRDRRSAERLGLPCRVLPDIALASTLLGQGPRHRLALSPRAKRAWPAAAVRMLIETGAGLGLDPIVVTQVRSDEPTHREFARSFGIEHLGWESRSIGEQLDRVESVYSSTAVVVSDRLHALVLALGRGAACIPWGQDDKVVSALDTIGWPEGACREPRRLAEVVAAITRTPTLVDDVVVSASDQLAHARSAFRRECLGDMDG